MRKRTFTNAERQELIDRIQRIVDAQPKAGQTKPEYTAWDFEADIGKLERDLAEMTAPARRDPQTEREQAKFLIRQGLEALPANERAEVFDEVWSELWDASN